MPISVSMVDGKVYVGFVCRGVNPGEKREGIRILPLISGYRDSELRVKFTTDYTTHYEEIEKSNSACTHPSCAMNYQSTLAHLDPTDFEIVIERSMIRTINIFDLDAYALFQEKENSQPKLDM